VTVDLGLTEGEITRRLIYETLTVMAAQGTRVDVPRGQAILIDFNAEVQRAVHRVVLRLEAAARACEALDGRWGLLAQCERPGTTLRDGHRACRQHDRARTVRWS
jgi:hypothetical protein